LTVEATAETRVPMNRDGAA